MTETEILEQHKEHLCSNYKPIFGQSVTVNRRPLRNPINNIEVRVCMKSTFSGINKNRCDLCDQFNNKITEEAHEK